MPRSRLPVAALALAGLLGLPAGPGAQQQRTIASAAPEKPPGVPGGEGHD
jgi:hypothetical protein